MKKHYNISESDKVGKYFYNLLIMICLLGLMLCLQNISFAQQTDLPDTILFKIIKTKFSSVERSEETLFIYKSGRVDCAKSTKKISKRERTQKTVRCFTVSEDQIFELIDIAEGTRFLNASDNYRFFSGGEYDGASALIIYYRDKFTKTIILGTSNTTDNNAPPPDSVNKFLNKIQKINQTMELKYELDKNLGYKPKYLLRQ